MKTSRICFSSFVCCVALVLSNASAAEKPNVLLILVDDLKPSFGAYGDDWVDSPNLDRLAGSGMRFDMAYCNQAVCAPSRNNLLVGSRSTSIGVYSLGRHFRHAVPDAVTMPQYFKNNGYHAAGIGKVFHIGHGNINDEFSWSVPFHADKVIDYVLPESTDGQLTKEQALFSNKPAKGLPRGAAWEKADVDDGDYADGRIATEAIKRLRAYKESGQPFFLATGFTKPHLPFCAPTKYWDLYDPAKLPVTTIREYPNGAPAYAAKTELGELNQYKPVPEKLPLTDEMERTLIHGYYAALSYMDSQLGRVLDELKQLELDENTIVVLWGDHGYHLGDHGAWTKHTNYEQANRIPILIRAPGVTKPGSSTKALIETVDIFPTVAELAGLPGPPGPQPIDGRSFVSVLKDGSESIKDHAYHCFPRGRRLGRAIRTHQYRLVEWKEPGASTNLAEYELYDYENDPLETKNLASERPDAVEKLAAMLATHSEAKPRDRPAPLDIDPTRYVPRALDESPIIANQSLKILAEGKADNPQGVVISQGGREQGYAVHFIDGKPAFDVRVNAKVTRIVGEKPVHRGFRLEATLTAEEMTLVVNDQTVATAKSPGLIPVQPQDALSVGLDILSAAGDYEAPNVFNGTIISTNVETSGDDPSPTAAAAMDRKTIEAGLRSHDRALLIKSGWIRDPYIVLAADDYFYLTGTTPLPDDPRNQTDPYNTGLGQESIVGWQMQAWGSRDLIDWESLEVPFSLKDGIWFQENRDRFNQVQEQQWRLWAPELHDVGGRWAIVHTSPSPVKGANLALTKDLNLQGPFEHPMGARIGKRHDPSMFKNDDGTWWMIWGATEIAPLKPDFSAFAAKPITIGPSGETKKMGHEGCLMHKIGDKYVLFGTGWSTGLGRRGSYNLYYATAYEITGPYSERKFAGRFLGHGTPFRDKQGRWWCTAFYNANIPPLSTAGIRRRDLSDTAQTINQQGVTIVPLDVRVQDDGEVYIRAIDPNYASPGPDEAQRFE